MAIVAVGSLAYDSIITEKESRERILGGSLSHFANAAAFLSKPKLVGVIGDDFLDEDIKFLKKKTSSLEGVERAEGRKSFFWKGKYSPNFDERESLATELNAFEHFDPKVPESYHDEDYILFLANIDPVTQSRVVDLCAGARLSVLDTMNFWIEKTPKELSSVFKKVDAVIINEEEAAMLTKTPDLVKAGKILMDREGFKFLILKKGSNGVMVFGEDYIVSLPAFPVDPVVDPTGAGDSFAGAFFSYLDKHGMDLSCETVKTAAVYATIVASFCVQGFGVDGIDSVSDEDIQNRMEDFRRASGF